MNEAVEFSMRKVGAILRSLEHRSKTVPVNRGYKAESQLDVHLSIFDRRVYKEGPIDFGL